VRKTFGGFNASLVVWRLDTIDKRSQVGCALRRLREELTAQLGGADVVTPALSYLIDEVAKKLVITQTTGEYILKQDTLVRRDALLRVVEQHAP
jgi:hypothetical protein